MYAVFYALLFQFKQLANVGFVETKHHTAVAFERKIQFAGKCVKHGVACNVELRLKRAGLCVVTSVHYTAVCLARAYRHVIAAFQQQNIRVETGQFTRDGTAHYAAADNNYVFHIFPPKGVLYGCANGNDIKTAIYRLYYYKLFLIQFQ